MSTDGSIHVPNVDPTNLDTPSAGRSRICVDVATGRLSTKDSSGTVTTYGDDADVTALAAQVATNIGDIATNAGDISAHIADTANPHGVTRAQVGIASGDTNGQILEWDTGTDEWIKSARMYFDEAEPTGAGLRVEGNIIAGPAGSIKLRRVASPAPATILGANNTFNSVALTSTEETLILGRSNNIRPPPSSGGNITVVGYNNTISNSSNSNILLIGQSVSLTGLSANAVVIANGGGFSSGCQDSVIIGRPDGTGADAVIIGRTAQGGAGTVALGRNAKATATGAIALGRNSLAASTYSVAIGYDASTTAGNQVRIGSVSRPLTLSCSSTVSVDSTSDSTSVSSGSFTTLGGAGVAKALYVGTSVNVRPTSAYSCFTARVAEGFGVPVGDNVFVSLEGGALTSHGNSYGILTNHVARSASTDKIIGSSGFRTGAAWGTGTLDSVFVIKTRKSDTLADRFVINGTDAQLDATLLVTQDVTVQHTGTTSLNVISASGNGSSAILLGEGGAAEAQIKYDGTPNTIFIGKSDGTKNVSIERDSGDTTISSTTTSTSTTTGALKVSGGLGVVGALYVGGTIKHRASSTIGTYLLDIEGGSADDELAQLRRQNTNGGGFQFTANNGDVVLFFTDQSYNRRAYVASKANSTQMYIGCGSSLSGANSAISIDSSNQTNLRNRVTIEGGLVLPSSDKAANYTMTSADHIIKITGAGVTIELYDSPTNGWQAVVVNRDAGANTVDGNGKNIEGSATIAIPGNSTKRFNFNTTTDEWEDIT